MVSLDEGFRPQISFSLILSLFFMYTVPASGKIEDVIDIERKAQQQAIDQFTTFTKDKNVQGKAQKPDGTRVRSPDKSALDRDKKTNFQSDLTYHLNTFWSSIKNAAGKAVSVLPFVSQHGSISADGGSSFLERLVWKWHELFSKEDENKPPTSKQEGIRTESVFEIKTTKADPNATDETARRSPPTGTSSGTRGSTNRDESVEQRTLREPVRKEVEDAGDKATDTVVEAAKSPDTKKDKNAMPNITDMYEAAKRATTIGFWNPTIANLGQRRAFLNSNRTVELNEDTESCEKWRANELARIGQKGTPSQSELQSVEDQTQKCRAMIAQPYSAVNPQFENVSGPGSASANLEVKEKGPSGEDSYERDLRVQAELASGKKLNDIEKAWPYSEEDAKALVTLQFGPNGEPTEKKNLTIQEQYGLYNKQLEAAKKGYDEALKYLPNTKVNTNDILKFKRDENTPIWLNNQPTQALMEEMGAKESPQIPVPKSYSDLLQQPN